MSAEQKRLKKAEDLERRATFNIKTADSMEQCFIPADLEFTQELRDRVFQWQEQATRLRDPLRRRGKA